MVNMMIQRNMERFTHSNSEKGKNNKTTETEYSALSPSLVIINRHLPPFLCGEGHGCRTWYIT